MAPKRMTFPGPWTPWVRTQQPMPSVNPIDFVTHRLIGTSDEAKAAAPPWMLALIVIAKAARKVMPEPINEPRCTAHTKGSAVSGMCWLCAFDDLDQAVLDLEKAVL